MTQRVAVITGAGRGIGRAIALALAADGHALALAARSVDELHSVADEATQVGSPAAIAVPTDVTDPASVDALINAAVAKLGPPTIVINNAGIADSHKFAGHPDALWLRTMAINLTGPYLVTKAAAPHLLAGGWGRVVNMGSVASLTGARYIAAYTASKHGLLGLTRALAAEWVDKGITVNLVAPGYVDTGMTANTVANIVARTGRSESEARALVDAMSPQGHLVSPDDVAALVRLLVSDAAGAITGAVIPVDGGASAFAGRG